MHNKRGIVEEINGSSVGAVVRVAAGAVALACLPQWAGAQSSDIGLETGEPVVVIGRPIIEANSVDSFASLRTDVGEAQIRDLNALDVSSAMRRTPGVTISRFNVVGSFGGEEGGAVYIRGLGASRPGSEIKTYIDGLPFYMSVWNHPLLDLLPVHGMEQISVHKAPQPQAFGNTFAAIDLQPRRARDPGQQGSLRLAGGSYSTLIEQAELSGRSDAWDYSLAQGYARSNGHRDDADGRLLNAMGRVGYRLNDHWAASVTLLHADNRVKDPGREGNPASRTGRYDTQGTFAALSLDHEYDGLQGRMQIYRSEGEGNWLGRPGTDGDTLTDFVLSGLRWRENVLAWPGGTVLLGLDVDSVSGDVRFNTVGAVAPSRFNGPTLTVTSPYLGLSHAQEIGGGWSVVPSAGIRYYRHNELDSASAPHAGLVVKSNDVALRINAARGINYPGLDAALLNAIVPPLAATPDGWRELKPERLDHLEIGIALNPSPSTTLDLALFEDKLENRYVFAFPPAVSLPGFTNLGSYRIKGMEGTLQQMLSRSLSLFLGATYLDSSLASLPYAPRHLYVLGLSATKDRWHAAVDAQYQSRILVLGQSRANGTLNTEQVGGFAVFNLRVGYDLAGLGNRGEVYMAVENLLDRDYAFRAGYPMPGLSVQLGLVMGL